MEIQIPTAMKPTQRSIEAIPNGICSETAASISPEGSKTAITSTKHAATIAETRDRRLLD
jgi:hypothetical protein